MTKQFWKKLIVFSLSICFYVGIGMSYLMLQQRVFADTNYQSQSVEKNEDNSNSDNKESKEKKKQKEKADLIYEVEVVAKRVPENPFKTERTIDVLNSKSILEQLPRTVPEALYDSPGTFVQETSQGGGSPIIRGMVGPQLLIMVDGVRFNNSTFRSGPGQYLNIIDPLSVDRIEILCGPGSVLYGSDAMGGVIQVTPLSFILPSKNKSLTVKPNLMTRYLSANNGLVTHGHLNIAYRDFAFLGGITYKKFNDLRGGEGVGKQRYEGYDHYSAVGKTMFWLSRNGALKDWNLSMGYLFSNIDDAGRTDQLYNNNSLQIYDNIDHLVYTRLHMVYPGMNTEGDLTFSYHDFFERKDTIKVKDDYVTPIKTTRDDVKARTLGIDLNMNAWLKKDKLRLSYGGMWYRDAVNADRFTRNSGEDWVDSSVKNYPDNSRYSNYGVYTHLEWSPFKWKNGHMLRLGAGYRLHGMTAYAPATGPLEALDFSYTGHVFLGSVQYLFGELSNISFTYSQGFRSPNLQETAMMGDAGIYFRVPNYDLKPERSETFELVTRTRIGSLVISWTGYISLINGLLKTDYTKWNGMSEVENKKIMHSINGGEAILWGTEGMLLLELSKGFSASGQITYTWGKERFPQGGGEPLTRIPPLFGQLNIRYDFYKFLGRTGFIETYIRAATKQDRLSKTDKGDSRIPPGGTPGWWTWNFRTGLNLFKHVRMSLILDNIFNKKYKYHGSGIYSPGTSLTLSMEVY